MPIALQGMGAMMPSTDPTEMLINAMIARGAPVNDQSNLFQPITSGVLKLLRAKYGGGGYGPDPSMSQVQTATQAGGVIPSLSSIAAALPPGGS